jgi:imidazole glycerol phosphate synthase subunit HisF
MSNIKDAIQLGNASALAIASIFHYATMKKVVHRNSDNTEGNNSFKNSGKIFSIIEACNISDVKNILKENKIPCRPIN